MSAPIGMLVWAAILFILFSASVWLIWSLNGRPPTLLHLFGYIFAPALVCFQAGQISILFLFGVVLFLCWHERWPLRPGRRCCPAR